MITAYYYDMTPRNSVKLKVYPYLVFHEWPYSSELNPQRTRKSHIPPSVSTPDLVLKTPY